MFSLDTGFAILSFFIVIGPLIFFHELGHFLAARAFNIEVEEFGIGFPPRAMTLFEQGGTTFTLNWIPLGGFVRPKGEDDPDVEGGLSAASKTARFSVLVAGAGANMLVAFVLLVFMYMIGAEVFEPGAVVRVVEEDSPAAAAGLQEGDIITAVDDETVEQFSDLTTYIISNTGQTLTLTFERNGETMQTAITPRENPPEGQGPTGIQVGANGRFEQFGLFGAIGQAINEIVEMVYAFIDFPRQIIQGSLDARYARPVSVVGISQLGGQVVESSIEQNALYPIIRLTAVISVALAVTNLLPIPALDGGRILFVIIEAIRGKRVKPEHEMTIHFVGFAALMVLMVVTVVLDIVDPLF